MNPTITALLTGLFEGNMTPAIVEHVTEDDMYIGYCTPDCTGVADPKWMLKHVITDERGVQTIFFAEGSPLFNKRWDMRRNYDYKPTEVWK